MEYRVIPVLVTIVVVIIGFFYKIHHIKLYVKRREFTILFHENFSEMVNNFIEKNRIQNDTYAKCIHDVDAIQLELGDDGVMAEYVDHLNGVIGRNYQLFMNIIPELRNAEYMRDNSIAMERVEQLVGYCDDALYRHVGNLDRMLENERKGIFNPFVCFGEGIHFMIDFPINVLYWCGILNTNSTIRVQRSWIFKVFGKAITLIGLISSIITIILGWNDAVAYFA